MGGINMPGYRPGQIAAIAQALEAVHNVYGIDTEKERAALMKTQNQQAQTELQLKQTGLQHLTDFMDRARASASPSPNPAATGGQSSDPDSAPNPKNPLGLSNKSLDEAIADPFVSGFIEPSIKARSEQNESTIKGNQGYEKAFSDFKKDAADEIENTKFQNSFSNLINKKGPLTGKMVSAGILKMSGYFNRIPTDAAEENSEAIGLIPQLFQGAKENFEQDIGPARRNQLITAFNAFKSANQKMLGEKAMSAAAAQYRTTGGTQEGLAAELMKPYQSSGGPLPLISNEGASTQSNNGPSSFMASIVPKAAPPQGIDQGVAQSTTQGAPRFTPDVVAYAKKWNITPDMALQQKNRKLKAGAQ